MFNFIDLIVLALIIFLIWQGARTGFVGGVLNLITTVISLFSAIAFYPTLGNLLNDTFAWGQNLSQIAAFFLILIVLEVALSFVASRFYGRLVPFYKKFEAFLVLDKSLGVIPSLIVGLTLASLFLLLPLILPVNQVVKKPIEESWWGSNVLPIGLRYQPAVEKFLNRLPYKNLAYLITPEPTSEEIVKLEIPKKAEFKPDAESEGKMLQLV